jgi:hypothetical protein
MDSRLFRAIVGVGLALGAAGTACSTAVIAEGASTDAPDASSVDARPLQPVAPEVAAPPDSSASPDALADAGAPIDDAAADAYLGAFCDAAWPTTKASRGVPQCGDVSACLLGATQVPYCIPSSGAGKCDDHDRDPDAGVASVIQPVWCVDGGWECARGSIPSTSCSCWTDPNRASYFAVDDASACPAP